MRRMAQKKIILDDLTGEELPEGTRETILSIDGKVYRWHLSTDGREKLNAALRPFLERGRRTAI